MTNQQVADAFVRGETHGQSGSMLLAPLAEGTAVYSYGVPIAYRKGESVFVDTFSQWSNTTSQHVGRVFRAAKDSGLNVHRVTLDVLQGSAIGREVTRRKPSGQRDQRQFAAR